MRIFWLRYFQVRNKTGAYLRQPCMRVIAFCILFDEVRPSIRSPQIESHQDVLIAERRKWVFDEEKTFIM